MKSIKTLTGILAGLGLGFAVIQPAIGQEKTLFERLKPHVDESWRIKGTTLDRAVNPESGYEWITCKLPDGQILTVYYAISTGRLNDIRYPFAYKISNEELWIDRGHDGKLPDGLNGNEERIR